MMRRPKVSVLVPTFNAVPFLEQALDSLAAQTLEDIEFICINDGSTDTSPEVLDRYAAQDPRFKVIHKSNSGYGASMNVGLRHATGEYIGILEPDDYASPLMFEGLYAASLDGRVDVVKGNFNAVTTAPTVKINKVALFPADKAGKVLRPASEPWIFRARPAIWAGMYKASFLQENGIQFLETPGASYQDAGFNFKVWAAASEAVLVDDAYLYYRTDNAASSVKDPGKVWAVADEYSSIWEFINTLEHRETIIPIFQGARFEAFRWNLERLAPEIRGEFFEYTEKEYNAAQARAELRREFFNGNNWRALQELVNDSSRLKLAGCLLKSHDTALPPTTAPGAGEPVKGLGVPLVSLIIPVFNAARFLKDCLDSALGQTHGNIEVICVNDGSTDLSEAILGHFAALDCRVKVINQPNAGAGTARNVGIRAAQGQYLLFLDADDVFDPTMVEKAVRTAEGAGADVCVFQADSFNDGQPGVYRPIAHGIRRHLLPDAPVFGARHVQKDIFSLFQGWAWDKLFRADFVRRNRLEFQDLRTTNDLRFVMTAISVADRIVILDESLIHQRREVVSSLSRTRERSWNNYLLALEGLRLELESRELYGVFKLDFLSYAVELSMWNLRTLDPAARTALLVALRDEWCARLGLEGVEPARLHDPGLAQALREMIGEAPASTGEGPDVGEPKGLTGDAEAGPMLSVIVPVYNMEDYLRECLESVLQFSGVPLEVVCVNDGSTDSSAEILEEYRRSDSRLVVVHQANSGLSGARNRGLEVASGEYALFLDSDDVLRPVDLPALLAYASENDLDIMGYDARSFLEGETVSDSWQILGKYYQRSRSYGRIMPGANLLAEQRSHHDYRVSCCLYLARRSLIESLGLRFQKGIIHEDNAFTFALMVAAGRAAHARVELYGRRVRAGSIMTSGAHADSALGYLGSVPAMLQTLLSWGGDDPFVAKHLAGVVYQVLHNSQDQFSRQAAVSPKSIGERSGEPVLSLFARVVQNMGHVHSRKH
ncbi:glycosyltransferase [Tessaracoccus lacteus]|uniref:Glycosyltransferase n=1 Tax=Tessaracoccus lacteus TaxID=3041766 RepID=A0ABY8PXD4_9ACTN|nr:glycosyltransferase [Tessaracoccus sp. T21]WGT47036.1 glycosyltransferase [Tessaracoccus sp. T21]